MIIVVRARCPFYYCVHLFRPLYKLWSGLEEDYKSDREEGSDTSASEEEEDRVFDEMVRIQAGKRPTETPYVSNTVEELGQVRTALSKLGLCLLKHKISVVLLTVL